MKKALLSLAALFLLAGNATASSTPSPSTVEEMKAGLVLGPWVRFRYMN